MEMGGKSKKPRDENEAQKSSKSQNFLVFTTVFSFALVAVLFAVYGSKKVEVAPKSEKVTMEELMVKAKAETTLRKCEKLRYWGVS